MSQVVIESDFSAPPEKVFQALSDNERMGSWLGARITVPIPVEGGAVGTVRRIHAGLIHIDEKILEHQPPHRIVYRIINRVPAVRDHRGEIRIVPGAAGGSTVRWSIYLDSPLPGVAALITRVLRVAIRAGLARLDKRL